MTESRVPRALPRLLPPAALLLLFTTLPAAALQPPAEPEDPAPAAAAPEAEPPPAGAEEDPSAAAPAAPVDEEPLPAVLSDEIVVSAERLARPEAEVGSSVTVIGREEIELSHETTVLELLRTVPGVEVVQAGGPGRLASVFLRGAGSEHTLVLLDGVRVNSVTGGGFDFADLSTDNLERIEVLRGPQSTLYGSEAMGGVISITTRRGTGAPGWAADLRAGSFGTERLALSAAAGRGAFDYAVAASLVDTDGVTVAARRLGNSEEDPYENTTVSGRLGWRVDRQTRADLTLRVSDGETGLDGFDFATGPVDDVDFFQVRRVAQVGASVEHAVSERFRASARLATVREETVGEDPSTAFNNFEIDGRLDTLGASADLDLGPAGRLTAGYDLERREAENRGAFDDATELRSAFALHRWGWRERLFVTAGARHDDYSETSGETTWRLTGAWIAPGVGGRLHGSAGTGFRVPTMTELFFPGAGNPELVPESSEGYDLGWEQALPGTLGSVDVTWFRTTFTDLVSFDFSTFTFANVAEAESEGIEAVASLALDPVDLTLAWTWNETDDGTGRPLPRRPENRGSLGVSYAPAVGWRGTLTLVAVADRVDSDGSDMDDYERLDLALEAPALGRFRPYLRVDNLLDQEYEEVPGFTTPGFGAFVGLRVTP